MSLTAEEQKLLNHDIRNQLSNLVMTVTELKLLIDIKNDEQLFLFQTLENCCRNIDRLLVKSD